MVHAKLLPQNRELTSLAGHSQQKLLRPKAASSVRTGPRRATTFGCSERWITTKRTSALSQIRMVVSSTCSVASSSSAGY